MYDYFGHGFHILSVIKHLKAKILSDGGPCSNLCQFMGPQCEKVWEPLLYETYNVTLLVMSPWMSTLTSLLHACNARSNHSKTSYTILPLWNVLCANDETLRKVNKHISQPRLSHFSPIFLALASGLCSVALKTHIFVLRKGRNHKNLVFSSTVTLYPNHRFVVLLWKFTVMVKSINYSNAHNSSLRG